MAARHKDVTVASTKNVSLKISRIVLSASSTPKNLTGIRGGKVTPPAAAKRNSPATPYWLRSVRGQPFEASPRKDRRLSLAPAAGKHVPPGKDRRQSLGPAVGKRVAPVAVLVPQRSKGMSLASGVPRSHKRQERAVIEEDDDDLYEPPRKISAPGRPRKISTPGRHGVKRRGSDSDAESDVESESTANKTAVKPPPQKIAKLNGPTLVVKKQARKSEVISTVTSTVLSSAVLDLADSSTQTIRKRTQTSSHQSQTGKPLAMFPPESSAILVGDRSSKTMISTYVARDDSEVVSRPTAGPRNLQNNGLSDIVKASSTDSEKQRWALSGHLSPLMDRLWSSKSGERSTKIVSTSSSSQPHSINDIEDDTSAVVIERNISTRSGDISASGIGGADAENVGKDYTKVKTRRKKEGHNTAELQPAVHHTSQHSAVANRRGACMMCGFVIVSVAALAAWLSLSYMYTD